MNLELISLARLSRMQVSHRSSKTRSRRTPVQTGWLRCANGHRYPIENGVPRFVQHHLDADQARTRDSFGYEWTRLYPAHGHTTPEWQAERDIFLEYTRTVPSDFKGKLVLDGGCGNGRYAKMANDWGARVVAVDISSAVEIASAESGRRADVDVIQADLFKLPFRPETFDLAYRSACCTTRPTRGARSRRFNPSSSPVACSRSSSTARGIAPCTRPTAGCAPGPRMRHTRRPGASARC